MILRWYTDRVTPSAARAIEFLADALGAQARLVENLAEAVLVHTARRPEWMQGIWVRRADSLPPVDHFEAVIDGAVHQLAQDGRTIVLHDDVLAVAAAILDGDAERALPANRHGVPLLAGPEAVAGLLRRPVLSELAQAFAHALQSRVRDFSARIPRWPAGKSAALMLTHDVDMPYRRPRSDFYLRRLARSVRGASISDGVRAMGGWLNARRRHGRSLPVGEDANFGFRFWQDLERSLGGRGCFYVAVRSACARDGHPQDVPYRAQDPEVVAAMRTAVEAGWEIGLHASIACQAEPERFLEERAMLERLIGVPVRGVRHHFWALRPGAPEHTWRAQDAAGFAYDSSLGSNDAPGFRRGLAWPFIPNGTGLLQVPPTLMDGGLFYTGPEPAEGRAAIRRHLQTVFGLGGAAVLDWHLEQSNPTRLHGAGPALVDALDAVRARGDIWVTTPSDAADWWRHRAALRAALGRTRDRIRLALRPSVPPASAERRAAPEARTRRSSTQP
ncbi:MAG: hypothetical protein JJ896_13965 [Rhodothermales bacterium]|nr:hypothetical protein [Rhodothermales bacterium]MBO6780756.1 hypothetical protein [Rhodothermales bacterium]